MNEVKPTQLDEFLKNSPTPNTPQNTTDIIGATNTSNNFLSEINRIFENFNSLINNPLFQNKIFKKENENTNQIQNQPPPLRTEPPRQIIKEIPKGVDENKIYSFFMEFLKNIIEIKKDATIKELYDDLLEKENQVKEMIKKL